MSAAASLLPTRVRSHARSARSSPRSRPGWMGWISQCRRVYGLSLAVPWSLAACQWWYRCCYGVAIPCISPTASMAACRMLERLASAFPRGYCVPTPRPALPQHATIRCSAPPATSADRMAGPFRLPADVREGDWIEIGQLGAYGACLRTGFNGFDVVHTVEVCDRPML